MKQARSTFDGPYDCQKPWPEECFVQCGGKGLVLNTRSGGKPYTTAFFEAFPTIGEFEGCFLRGEGTTIQEAEEQCWKKYQKHLNCPNHEFEPRGRTDGSGFCKHCNLFKSGVLPCLDRCKTCEKTLSKTNGGNWHGYCKEHFLASEEGEKFKKEMKPSIARNIYHFRNILRRFDEPNPEDKAFFATKTPEQIAELKAARQKQYDEYMAEFKEYGGTPEELDQYIANILESIRKANERAAERESRLSV